MKKILCLLLCLLFMPWAVAEDMNADAEKWLKEKSLEMAALADDAMDSHAFTQAMMGKYFPFSDPPENVLAELRQVDFSNPVSMKILLAPGIAADEILQAMQPMMAEGDISPALADWIIRLVNGILPAGLLPADDFDFSLLSSAFTVGSGYICPEFITESAWVTLEYDGDYMLLVSFDLIKDNGVISAGTTLLPADAMDQLEEVHAQMRAMIHADASGSALIPGEEGGVVPGSVSISFFGTEEVEELEDVWQIIEQYKIEQ